ncbi:COG1476 Predicted transcriptional regulators [Spirosomataceae bacterium]
MLKEKIKELRAKKGITQAKLALLMQIKPNTVAAWELGYSSPECSRIPLLCEILDTTPNELFGWE